ncbi:helix-turn-helix transcriptional regulator [Ottowia testudinis]|uniref:Helix-turn-helix transcriptional regulator n=1 Tax=Ottowia testudinis TaxID=2816950 RepID=A0A975H4A3_9BURK|nr:helix-turn-helix transcriptional regulator [Ottowia testudinis]
MKLTQKEAAEGCRVSREMWGRYERDDAMPGANVLENFVSLGAYPDVLLGDPGNESRQGIALLLSEIAAQLGLYNKQNELDAIERKLLEESRSDWKEMLGGPVAPSNQPSAASLMENWLSCSPHVLFPRHRWALEDAIQTLEFALEVADKKMTPQDKASAIEELWRDAKQGNRDRVDLASVKALIDKSASSGRL